MSLVRDWQKPLSSFMKTNCDYYYIVIFKMKLCVIHNSD